MALLSFGQPSVSVGSLCMLFTKIMVVRTSALVKSIFINDLDIAFHFGFAFSFTVILDLQFYRPVFNFRISLLLCF